MAARPVRTPEARWLPRIVAQVGNAALLYTRKIGLLCSRRCPGTIIVQTLDLALALRDSAATVVGGFQSSMEKECLDTLLRGKHPVIVCPARCIDGMRLPVTWKSAIAENRMLVASSFGPKCRRATAQLADLRNRFVADLADEIVIAHASPGGQLERLCQNLTGNGKPIWTLDDPANVHLVALGIRPIRPTDAGAL
jgi:predicted Rossmann fold nucleotide-binding protein DprA/Smf involved in DNA uptake